MWHAFWADISVVVTALCTRYGPRLLSFPQGLIYLDELSCLSGLIED